MHIFFYYIILIQFYAITQNCIFKGRLVDNHSSEGLRGAVIKVKDKNDNLLIIETDSNGFFYHNLRKCDSVSIQINLLGYKPFEKKIFINNDLELSIPLEPKEVELAEVKIEGVVQRIEQKGDTTTYNAKAFKVNKDATVEDLVQKMPGISVQNGQIISQGERIQKVLVDGKEFFGEDVMLALKNISAEMVDKIQTFDRPSDKARFTGLDDGQSTRTLNIVTKKGSEISKNRKFSTGLGFDNRYLISGIANQFSENKKITALAMANNINQQNFSNADLGISPKIAPQRPNQPLGEFATLEQNGIAKTYAIGFNISQYLGKKINFNFSNFFNIKDLNAQALVQREFLNSDTIKRYYNEERELNNWNLNYRFSSKSEITFDSNNALIWTPKLSYQKSNVQNEIYANNQRGIDTINVLFNNNPSNGKSLSMGQNFLFLHKFKKVGRTITLSNETEFVENKNKVWVQGYKKTFIPDMDSSANLFRQLLNTKNLSNHALLIFTEKITKNTLVSLGGGFFSQQTEFERLNLLSQNTMDIEKNIDTFKSSDLNVAIHKKIISLGLKKKSEKINVEYELKYEHVTLRNRYIIPSTYLRQFNFRNFLPFVRVNYSFTKNKTLRFFYKTNTEIPSSSQFQEGIDNQNPVILTTGNPSLNQQYTHILFLRIFLMEPEKNKNFMFYHINTFINNFLSTQNIILTKDTTINQIFLPKGIILNRPQNLNGYWQSRNYVYYTFPLKVILTSAICKGFLCFEPLKMMFSIFSERNDFVFCSPNTQRILSTTFDLPLPLGPTIQVIPLSK